MPLITAMLHTHTDALRLGRCLETLYPCDEVVVIDYGSEDGTPHIARAYGAKVIAATSLATPCSIGRGWLLCLDPLESLTEALAASLYEWKSESLSADSSFSVLVREETAAGWIDQPQPQTRLVPACWQRWQGCLPVNDPSSLTLEGRLLRFASP